MRKKIDEPISVVIERLSHEGRGIGYYNNRIVFVRNALPGETVQVLLTRQHSRYLEGNAIEIQKPSFKRVSPKCPHTLSCGGCQMQHLKHAHQIAFKQNILLEQLEHNHIIPHEISPPVFSYPYYYRHKARLSVKFVPKKNTVLVGFREYNGRLITQIDTCPILHGSVSQKISELRQLIHTLDAYQTIAQIEIAVGDQASAYIFRHLEPLSQNDVDALKIFARTHEIQLYLQPKGPDSIHRIWPLDGSHRLIYELKAYGIHFEFFPTDFTQINSRINQMLVAKAIEWLAPQPHETLLDLFCGLGNFTLPLTKFSKYVIGVEGSQQMVDRASYNAQLNQISNVDFHASDLENPGQPSWLTNDYHKVLLDPPRAGAKTILPLIQSSKLEKIVYISCHFSTFVRDAKWMIENTTFELKKVGIFDMFPHTDHFETIGLFQKK